MDPMTLALLAQGAPTVSSLLNYFLNPPKRFQYPVDQMAQNEFNSGMQNANAVNSQLGSQLGPRFAAQGLQRTGIASNMLSNAASKNYQGVMNRTSQLRDALLGKNAELNNTYQQQKRSALSGLLTGAGQDIGTGLGTMAGMGEADKQQAALQKMFRELYGQQPEQTGGLGRGNYFDSVQGSGVFDSVNGLGGAMRPPRPVKDPYADFRAYLHSILLGMNPSPYGEVYL
jgi:hypothetical protein